MTEDIKEVHEKDIVPPLKKILRTADEKDEKQHKRESPVKREITDTLSGKDRQASSGYETDRCRAYV